MSLPILHLHVKSVYFHEMKNGTKVNEYRAHKPFWIKQLIDEEGEPKEFSGIIIYNAYLPGEVNRLHFPWNGWTIETITHPHFGEEPVKVFAINVGVSGNKEESLIKSKNMQSELPATQKRS